MGVQSQEDTFSIDYSLGTISGHVGLDTMNMGTPPITITQQAFGLATESTADFTSTTCDGVFVSPLTYPPVQTFCHRLHRSNAVLRRCMHGG